MTTTDIAAIIEGTRPQDLLGWLSTFEADDHVCESMRANDCVARNYFTARCGDHRFYFGFVTAAWEEGSRSRHIDMPTWMEAYISDIFHSTPRTRDEMCVTAQQAIDLLGPYLTEAQMASAIAGE